MLKPLSAAAGAASAPPPLHWFLQLPSQKLRREREGQRQHEQQHEHKQQHERQYEQPEQQPEQH